MATGRTLDRWMRVYVDGYNLSGYTRSFGPFSWDHDYESQDCLSWEVQGGLFGHSIVNPGTLNGVFDNTATSGIHAVMSSRAKRTVMCPIGIRAAPAAGDPCFMGEFEQSAYMAEPGDVMSTVSIPFDTTSVTTGLDYGSPWGYLLHAAGNETAANTGSSDVDGGAETSAGGYMMYQIFSLTGGSGSVDISIDDSANDSDWLALSGASVTINYGDDPTAGIVELGTTATVRRYLRWQISLTTLTGVNFALAFVRG